MKLLRTLNDSHAVEFRSGAVSIGNFDGVHRGHARIMQRLRWRANQLGGPAVALTFDPHPATLLRPTVVPPPLTWLERRAELLAQAGVDVVIAYPTDANLLALSPSQFFSEIVVKRLAARALVEGPNFRFGCRREGDIRVLASLCDGAGLALDVVDPLVDGGELISSSRVRQLVGDGALDEANRLLTHPYRIRGLVGRGAGRGAGIGFPTANVEQIETLTPGVGVYAGLATLDAAEDGKHPTQSWPTAIHVGPNPTFGEHVRKVEAHLLDFQGDLYGQRIQVDFLSRLRDIHPFPSVDALRAQLARDVQAARRRVAEHS